MNNPFYIKPAGNILERAIINVLNILSNDMYCSKFNNLIENNENNKNDIISENLERKQDVSELADIIIELTEE